MGVMKAIIIKIVAIVISVCIAIGAVIGFFTVLSAKASSLSGDYSSYTDLGDYIVKTDEKDAIPTLTKAQLKQAVDSCFSGKAHDNYIAELDGFIEMQKKHKVNAAFAVAVAQTESTGGSNWDLISSSTNNWYSIQGSHGGGYVDRNGTSWNSYKDFTEATDEFGKLIEENYFPQGKISVDTVGTIYCDPPTEWAASVKAHLDKIYAAAGVEIPKSSGVFSGDTYRFGEHNYKLFKQGNYNDSFGSGRTIASAGCGATSIAICMTGYGVDVDPSSLTKRCASKYGYTCDLGNISPWMEEYGFKGDYYAFGSDAYEKMYNHIKSGKPVVFNIGAGGVLYRIDGSYSSHPYGHYLTLLGVNEKGHFFVGDPSSGSNNWTTIENLKNSSPYGYYLFDKK